jgi:putative peptidoglycan lipid II flippase
VSSKTPGPGLGKIFGLVAVLTVLSKVAGLARDIVVLQAFGTSVVADAYNYAYLLTGNVLVLFGGLGGPFHQSTVAILTPRKNESGTGKLVGQLFVFTIAALSILAILGWFVAPFLVSLVAPAPGHTVEYRHLLWTETTSQLRIMLPLVVIAGVVGISYGILNVYGHFFWPSLSPAIASLSIIVAVIGFADTAGGLSLAMGTLIGAVGQMLAQAPGLVKTPLKWGSSLKPQPGFDSYRAMLWPAMVSTSIGQLNIYIDSFFTSQLREGSWTAIVNANRLIQLPLGVLLTAMLVPILPRFTEQVAAKRVDDLKLELSRALKFLWFLALPMAALLLAVPGPIIQVLFERGQFNETSRQLVTTALVFLVPSIFFYVARDLVTRVFYAHHDSKTPYHVALLAIVVHLVLDWVLVGPLGIGGIALATTLVTVFNLTVLGIFLRVKIGAVGFTKLLEPVAIMIAGSVACGFAAYASHPWLSQQIMPGHFLGHLASVGISCTLGLVIYTAVCLVFKLEEPLMLVNRLTSRVSERSSSGP